jgi:hypothetical protein
MTLLAVREPAAAQVQNLEIKNTGEVMVFCPRCKAMQTVQISGSVLLPTRKFFQEGPFIYHDCGSTRPCRLYQNV